ncbi:MAG: DNA polymerase/3'-5' exonuclease PolX [Symbiobacteriia bacterium]
MDNREVTWVLLDMADLVELSGDDPFKAVAYRKAARAIDQLPEAITDVVAQGRLLEIPGVGKGIGGKVEEYVRTGTFHQYEELKERVPPGLREVLRIPGLGPKTAHLLYARLGVDSLDALGAALASGQVRELPGFGGKKEENLRHALESLRNLSDRTPLGHVLVWAVPLRHVVGALPGVQAAELAGSVRRQRDMVGDVDIVAAAADPPAVLQTFAGLRGIAEVLGQGDSKCSVVLENGRQVDLRVVLPEQYVTALHHFTGSKEHNVRLRTRAKELGLKLNEYGLFDEDGRPQPVRSEEDIYRGLGLAYIPPELREDRGEVEAAAEGALPDLVRLEDVRGDLHVHTRWSDGMQTVREMALAAKARGYEYIAISDHSPSLVVANGLTVERLREQWREIAEVQEEVGFPILRGAEVDILRDGSLDLPDEVLAELNIVTASIHSGFRQDEATLTGRILAAIANPHVDVIGHPTGRLLARRDAYPLNMDLVIDAARRTGTALEINASPERLDLSAEHARLARDAGVMIAINTDAHSIGTLDDMWFGVGQARRAWLGPQQVLNAMTFESLRDRLRGAGRGATGMESL